METQHDTDPLIVQGAHRLQEVAEAGESEETPLVVYGGVWVTVTIVALAIISLALIAYRIAA